MQLVSLATNPVPSGAVVGTCNGYDGAPLRFARWDATRGPRRGTVCLFEGRGEYIEKYFEVVAELRRRGFAVAVLDWRGQGGSYRALADKSRGHITSFQAYDRDLVRFMKEIVLPDCPPPYVALAHSMGGNILLRHATEAGSWFERMVLCAPMIAIAPSRLKAPPGLAQAYAEITSGVGLASRFVRGGTPVPMETQPFEDNLLSSDKERYQRNKAGGSPSVGPGLADERLVAGGVAVVGDAPGGGLPRACQSSSVTVCRRRRPDRVGRRHRTVRGGSEGRHAYSDAGRTA
jgi:lysophospholipase